MNPKNGLIMKYFGSAEVKPQIPTVEGIRANALEIFKQLEDRIAADSQTLDQIATRRQNELQAHELAVKNLMERHAAVMNNLSAEQTLVSDSIKAAQVMKANIAQIC